MNGKFRRRCARRMLLAVGFCLAATSWLWGQWNFLGPQWIAADSVASHAIALNDQRQVHVASVVGGGVQVEWFDGGDWQPLGAGLPTAGLDACALAFTQSDKALLALGPGLRLLVHDNGFWLPMSGLPTVAQARNLQLQVENGGSIWLAWWQPGIVDSTFVLSDRGGATWYVEGALPGRLADMALTDSGDPLLLLAGAPALLQFSNGNWNPFPVWSHPADAYSAIVTMQDGTDTSVVVLRRNASNALSVERYAQGGWQQLGNAAFAAGDAMDLAVSLSGTLHVACVDGTTQGLPQVFQFVAGAWQLLGGQYVYNNTVSVPRLAFDPATAFLLFQDDEQSHRNSVMYLGSPVGNVASLEEAAAMVFPNPVQSVAHVRLAQPARGGMARLYDANGRACGSQAVPQGVTEIDVTVAELPAGRYWMILTAPHHAAQICTFTKSH